MDTLGQHKGLKAYTKDKDRLKLGKVLAISLHTTAKDGIINLSSKFLMSGCYHLNLALPPCKPFAPTQNCRCSLIPLLTSITLYNIGLFY
jgi:hypothetical protein